MRLPPSLETLRARLTGRGTEKAEVIEKRLGEALSEISRAAEYDYIVVNNVLEEAVNDAVAIIKTDRMRTDRNLHLINDVLSK